MILKMVPTIEVRRNHSLTTNQTICKCFFLTNYMSKVDKNGAPFLLNQKIG